MKSKKLSAQRPGKRSDGSDVKENTRMVEMLRAIAAKIEELAAQFEQRAEE